MGRNCVMHLPSWEATGRRDAGRDVNGFMFWKDRPGCHAEEGAAVPRAAARGQSGGLSVAEGEDGGGLDQPSVLVAGKSWLAGVFGVEASRACRGTECREWGKK